jgi:pimeloyl-ACP methyl ester carboxylesterase
MTPTERDLLASDLSATAGFSQRAAQLLLLLAEKGPVAASAVVEPGDVAALAALVACGAAVVANGVIQHRPASWRLRRLSIRGTRLCVQTCGDGEALVLAPAFGTYRCLWGTPWTQAPNQLGPFSRSWRTVCVDYRGTGCSDITSEAYALEEWAADLDAVLDALGIARAHVLGVSLGGGVALRLALACPSRVASLVLCATNASAIDPVTRTKAEAFLALASSRSLEWAMRTYLRTPLAAATPDTVEAMLALGRRSVRTLDNFMNLYCANVFRTSVRERLGEIRVPTLVVVGEGDVPYFQEEAELLARHIADAELVRVPAAGHLVCVDDPTLFNQVVLRFLERQSHAERACDGRGAAPGASVPGLDTVSPAGSPRAAVSAEGGA